MSTNILFQVLLVVGACMPALKAMLYMYSVYVAMSQETILFPEGGNQSKDLTYLVGRDERLSLSESSLSHLNG